MVSMAGWCGLLLLLLMRARGVGAVGGRRAAVMSSWSVSWVLGRKGWTIRSNCAVSAVRIWMSVFSRL